MTYSPANHTRRSIRLKDYDYRQNGFYFVTICTQARICLFGEIIDGEMRPNEIGLAVSESLNWLANQYPQVKLDTWVLMPNHIHSIVIVSADKPGGSRTAPTEKTKPLGRLIGAFKTVSTKRINLLHNTPGNPVWQRNYYERVIRDEAELSRAREYIADNPRRWDMDKENPTFS
ncbi:MAG: transposase [Desulfuromonas sp.]|nr:transposase [Desulfuromonas sp.]